MYLSRVCLILCYCGAQDVDHATANDPPPPSDASPPELPPADDSDAHSLTEILSDERCVCV